MNEPMAPQDLYLEPERGLLRYWWLAAALLGALLLGGLALFLALDPNTLFATALPTATAPPSPEPTKTTLPTATPLPEVVLAAQPWTTNAPVGLVELTLQVPGAVQVSHEPPPGFRYWCGDLLPIRGADAAAPTWAWNSPGPAEARWFLLYEPDAVFPATIAVTVHGQTLTLSLYPGEPATVSTVWQ